MKLQKIIPAAAVVLCTCSISIFRIDAQQVAEIPHINSKVIVDRFADDLWNLLNEHPITFLIDGKDYPSTSDCSV